MANTQRRSTTQGAEPAAPTPETALWGEQDTAKPARAGRGASATAIAAALLGNSGDRKDRKN